MYPLFVYMSYEVSVLDNMICVTNFYSLVYFIIKGFYNMYNNELRNVGTVLILVNYKIKKKCYSELQLCLL